MEYINKILGDVEMKKYDVSVVVPVYNCGKYIEKCIKSIENQDYERLDKIVKSVYDFVSSYEFN